MRIRSILVLGTLLGAMATHGPAQETESRPAVDVEKLIADLGSQDFDRRRVASETLVRMGKDVIDALRAARTRLPLEARLRVDAILERLQGGGAPPRRGFEATRISLSIEDKPLSEVLSKLGEMAGTTITFGGSAARPPGRGAVVTPGDDRSVSLVADDIPFFEALEKLCRTQGFLMRRDYRTGAIQLSPGTPATQHVIFTGPLRAELTSFSVTRQIRSSGESFVNAHIQVQIDAENGVPLLGILSPMKASVVEDENGKNLVSDTQATHHYLLPADPRRRFNLTVPIKPPDRGVRKIKKIVCEARAIVPTKMATASCTGPFENGRSFEGPLAIKIDRVAKSGTTTTITFSFDATTPEGELPPNARVNNVETVHLFDADGKRINVPVSRRKQKEREIRTVSLRGQELHRLELSVVQAFETRVIPLTFENVEVP